MVEENCQYKIIIKKRNSIFKTVLTVWANTNNLEDVENLIKDKINKTYFSIVTSDAKVYVISTYEIEEVVVKPI